MVKAGWAPIAILPAVLMLAACGSSGQLGGLGAPSKAVAATDDAAVRASPVVVGRPARVFVFVALGARCETQAPPEVTVTVPPAKGELSFKPGQATTVATSTSGNCDGRNAIGTGMYYNARAGTDGRDQFTVTTRLASGETATRDFEVRIEQ